jgi:hypothetical protein
VRSVSLANTRIYFGYHISFVRYGREERWKRGLGWEDMREGRRSLRLCRHRWEGNIKMGFQEVFLAGINCIDLSRNRDRWRALLNAVMNLRSP